MNPKKLFVNEKLTDLMTEIENDLSKKSDSRRASMRIPSSQIQQIQIPSTKISNILESSSKFNPKRGSMKIELPDVKEIVQPIIPQEPQIIPRLVKSSPLKQEKNHAIFINYEWM